jgi:hypothetical protein
VVKHSGTVEAKKFLTSRITLIFSRGLCAKEVDSLKAHARIRKRGIFTKLPFC